MINFGFATLLSSMFVFLVGLTGVLITMEIASKKVADQVEDVVMLVGSCVLMPLILVGLGCVGLGLSLQ